MSLYDIFLQRAALQHQNMLNSDNAGIILQSLADGVGKGIQEEQAKVQAQRDEERKIKSEIELAKEKQKIEDASPLKQAQAKYYQSMGDIMENQDAQTRLIYRDPVTGEEVPADKAIADMETGQGRYVVNQVRTTRAGAIETPVVKPDTLTQSEREYITTANRIQSSLGTLRSGLDNLYKDKGNALFRQNQVSSAPYFMVTDKQLQDFKSSLNMLKADIPFLRGGKQLTTTEAKRVDVLLNPTGKNRDVYEKDLKTFEQEFLSGASLAKYGLSPMGMNDQPNQNNKVSETSPKTLDKQTALDILKSVGGDKNKAREKARQLGYSI